MAAAPHPAFTRSLRNQIGTMAPNMGSSTYTGQLTSSSGSAESIPPTPGPNWSWSTISLNGTYF